MSPVHQLGHMSQQPAHFEPVTLEVTRRCAWKAKGCGVCGKAKTNEVHKPRHPDHHGYQRRNGCAHCGLPKSHPDHLGAPESFNAFSTSPWQTYMSAKQRWHKVLAPQLEASSLERGMARITVEGEVSFGDAIERDQGNHRVILEKALGDILVEMGFIPGDAWHQYEFGGLTRREERGVNRTRLMLFPSAEATPLDDVQPTLI